MNSPSLPSISPFPLPSFSAVPFADLTSPILLVQQPDALRDSRCLLLSSVHPNVQVAADSVEVYSCTSTRSFRLIAIDLGDHRTAERLAFYARRRWPRAKILLLGRTCGDFGDSLYDEIVDPCGDPSGFVEVCKRLLRSGSAGPQ